MAPGSCSAFPCQGGFCTTDGYKLDDRTPCEDSTCPTCQERKGGRSGPSLSSFAVIECFPFLKAQSSHSENQVVTDTCHMAIGTQPKMVCACSQMPSSDVMDFSRPCRVRKTDVSFYLAIRTICPFWNPLTCCAQPGGGGVQKVPFLSSLYLCGSTLHPDAACP